MLTSTAIKLISDFNLEVFGRYLAQSTEPPACQVESSPFGQVFQILDQATPDHSDRAAVVWTRPEGIFESYRRALDLEEVSPGTALDEVDFFADHLLRYAESVRCVLLPSWVLPVGYRGYGMADYRPGLGLVHLLGRMNLHLAERLAVTSNVFMLDAERWVRAAGARASAPKMWYAGKVPYSNAVFQDAVADVKAALNGLAGAARRLVVVDLDNTLWGKTVGETGWQGITLGGHQHDGEAFVDFQRALKGLTHRGVQLGIASKNDEATALDAIDHHPEMVLRRESFAGWRINWGDKASNIVDLAADLNLGLGSVVFIDDHPVERARVRESLPEVLVPEWPEDPTQYRSALFALRCFDSPVVNAEDRQRTQMYVAERERRASRLAGGSLEDWLKTLDTRVLAERLSDANLSRAAQLFNKTNQMNLATRRLTESELMAWTGQPGRWMWTFTVTDRLGSSGLTGIVSLELTGSRARIVDFILSCRVMGRGVEDAMVHTAVSHAARLGVEEVRAEYHPTDRNGPCLAYWKQTAFTSADDRSFLLDPRAPYPLPEWVTLVQGVPDFTCREDQRK